MSSTSNRRPTVDGVLTALANERRRAIVAFLDDQPVAVDVERVAAFLEERTDADAGSLVVSLHHVHLPALEDARLVRFDPETGRIERRDDVPHDGRVNSMLDECSVSRE